MQSGLSPIGVKNPILAGREAQLRKQWVAVKYDIVLGTTRISERSPNNHESRRTELA